MATAVSMRAVDECGFLQLLLEDAPVDAFEEPVRRARARSAPPEELERLQHAAVLALQLRAILQDRRRREGELAALVETAGDLIAIRDLNRVLQAIVRRARQLLHADTAYLTLTDDDPAYTSMRVTAGMVGEEFARLRLPFGVGLGGLVAQAARPSFTANYLEDPRFLHAADIDGAVADEGIVAILGVPLLVNDRVIGVLFAADRTERHYTPDDVNLLGSLAVHAAIAIDNARLFQEAQRALADLNAANETVRRHSAAVERAAAVHDRLTDVVLRGGGAGDIAAILADVLHGAVTVVADDGAVVAHAGAAPCPDSAFVHRALGEVAVTGRSVRLRGDDGTPATWVAAVTAGTERLGALLLTGDAGLAGADLRTFERAAQVTALLLLTERSVTEAESRARGELLEDVLANAARDAERLRRRGRLLGVDLDAPHLVAVVSAPDRRRLVSAARGLVVERGGLVAERAAAVVVLPPAGVDDAAALCRRTFGPAATTGLAGPAASPAGIADAHRDAERCRRVLLALGREGTTTTAGELGVYRLLFSEAGRQELDAFVTGVLGDVLAYDETHQTALRETLAAYFGANGNVTRAAAGLHVHVNTLYQRLARITAILGPQWQEPARALDLHLALTVLRLREALEEHAVAATA